MLSLTLLAFGAICALCAIAVSSFLFQVGDELYLGMGPKTSLIFFLNLALLGGLAGLVIAIGETLLGFLRRTRAAESGGERRD